MDFDINIKTYIENDTGQRAKRNKICCPFHNEKTPSFQIYEKTGKFKCFGCGAYGDLIDYIRLSKNCSFSDALETLGIENESNKKECSLLDKVQSYINWQLKNFEDMKSWELQCIYKVYSEDGEIAYYKAKFKTGDKKSFRAYSFNEDGKVVFKRICVPLPYNLHQVIKGINDDRDIFIVEGEKDADTLNHLGYIATSLKDYSENSDFGAKYFYDANIYFVGDTGEAGNKYRNKVRTHIKGIARKYREVYLTGIENLGDNKDLTDWIEAGNTKDDFKSCLYASLDLNNKFELQQDFLGIYKYVEKKDKDGDKSLIPIHITNFSIIEASIIEYVDKEVEGIELTFKNQQGEIIKRKGESTKFDDIKSFRNFLGTMALTFTGEMKDLNTLKMWIYKYFTHSKKNIHTGIKLLDKKLITPTGAITSNSINQNIICDSSYNLCIDINNKASIGEIQEVINHLFNFQKHSITCSIVGTIINNLCFDLAQKRGVKFHHMLIVGESGSGKSTIKRDVINPLLSLPSDYEGNAVDKITDFALTSVLSDGNYPVLFDEFKPSMMNEHKKNFISSTLRSCYDNAEISRGNKSLKTNKFKLNSPVIICGEETYPNDEKALNDRTLFCYVSKRERTEFHTKSMKWLSNNKELLYKFSNTIIPYILSLNEEYYYELRECFGEYDKDNFAGKKLEDRLLNTFVNACTGMTILNDFIIGLGLNPINIDYAKEIKDNIFDNNTNDGEENYTIYEQMLIKFDDLLQNKMLDCPYDNIKSRNDRLFIKTSYIIDSLTKYKKDYNADIKILKASDFIKQAQKGGYIIEKPKGGIRFGVTSLRGCYYNEVLLASLGCETLAYYDELKDRSS